ncbi:hypothetical protein PIB30_086521 [Stylosanthes scabra]|uniref:Uncharacterized protein n=1 Tax=Stylosanthes scabra TaxID=79078 RepID=A0ABU6RTD6_9FABA|nr:hypothetical protein [Stylosanthes scabra]
METRIIPDEDMVDAATTKKVAEIFLPVRDMAADRRNTRSAPVESNPPLNTPTFVAAMNSMATAMRDSTVAMRESTTATHRAMEQLE